MTPKEYSGLIIDWFDLLAVQETLKNLFQHHSSKASMLQCSALFMDQLLYPYLTTGKTRALTTQTFVSKMISLLYNILSRTVRRPNQSLLKEINSRYSLQGLILKV